VSRILVTGASGFIGRAVASVLAAAGHEVRAAVRRPPAPPFPLGVEPVLHGDFEAGVAWRPLAAGMDFVVHVAGIAHGGRGIAPGRYDRVNRDATAQLADAARAAGIKRLVFVSSIRAQTGPAADRILTETDEPRPTDPYGRSKLFAETALRDSGVPFTVLRPVLVYGPGVRGNLRRLIAAAALPVPLPFGAFTKRRSLVGVQNLAAAIAHVLRHAAASGETYLVADPQALSLAEMVAALRRGLGRSPGLISVPPMLVRFALAALGSGADWDALGGQLVVDPAKLIATGWRPEPDTRRALGELTALARGTVRPRGRFSSP
jgi:nucleoside-diphosphate-sugar epimerase